MWGRRRLQECVILLCLFLTHGAEGGTRRSLEGQVITQELQISPFFLSHQAALATTNASDEKAPVDGNQRVHLPSMNCRHDDDCLLYSSQQLMCDERGQCICSPPYCWVYHYEVTGLWTASNIFTCGVCGVLGSSCNETNTCQHPGECHSDGYCHCPNSGENFDNVCLTTNTGWANIFAMSGMGIMIMFAVCLMVLSCYKEPPWRRSGGGWWCCCCGKDVQHRCRPHRKSPAFTIQSHYASQDLSTLPSDFNSVNMHGPGGVVPRRSRHPSQAVSETSIGETQSSISAKTTVTSLSDLASEGHSDLNIHLSSPPPSPPLSPLYHDPPSAHPPSHSHLDDFSSVPEVSTGHNEDDFSNTNAITPGVADPQVAPANSLSQDSMSTNTPGSCTHERCNLCLPKGPTTQPYRGSRMAASHNTFQLPLLSPPEVPHRDAMHLTQL